MAIYSVTVSPRGEGAPLEAADSSRIPPELQVAFASSPQPLRAVREDIYFLRVPDGVSASQVETFAVEFLAGSPRSLADCRPGAALPECAGEATLRIQRKPGVMDSVEQSVKHAMVDAGFAEGCGVRTARRYRIAGWAQSAAQLEALATDWLANPIVDDVFAALPGEEAAPADPFRAFPAQPGEAVTVPLRDADDDRLTAISNDGGLSLALEEMRTIRGYFDELGRDPTDVELETLAQTWSEHCCHKTLTGSIEYGDERIGNLLKETIFAVTQELDAPFCWSVFRDNAGVIALDDEWGLSFKVETHNHPSALEPYGGAGTGIGGVLRDTLGTGLGAYPVLSTDVFCFGPLDTPAEDLPRGTLSPQRLLTGVVAGVRDYGNRMGIPTANGAILFHPGYIGNPLVFCGSVGLIPRDAVDKTVNPGDLIVAMGGRTGRDGIHGATFSSRELTEESETISAGAVQIGNPIEERKLLDALMRARDERLFRAVTDCGAGGFSSAVGEMGEETGAEVELSGAPLKYPGLSPAEIWISEAQERMVLAVPPEHEARLFEILAEEEVEGCVLGKFTDDGMLRLRYEGDVVGELSMKFLHDGRPDLGRVASRPARPAEVAANPGTKSLGEQLDALIAHPSVASKEPVIRQYDHEVQGRMVLRPLTGVRGDAPADGCAFDPHRNGSHTVVVACGIQPLLGSVDAYEMGAQAVDEAVRNVIASGGNLDRLALLDNFAWGNVHDPEILGACIECARGAADAARAYRAPFVSGKDSLHNTYRTGGRLQSIPHTLLVSAMSVVEGEPKAPSSDLKAADSVLLVVGPRSASTAGSLWQQLHGGAGGEPCRFDAEFGPRVAEQLASWIAEGRVRSCHDLSEGGLAVAAAEMAIGGAGEGIDLELEGLEGDDPTALFGEGPHRYLVEVDPSEARTLLGSDVTVTRVGVVNSSGELCVRREGAELLRANVADLRERWLAPLASVWPAPPSEDVS